MRGGLRNHLAGCVCIPLIPGVPLLLLGNGWVNTLLRQRIHNLRASFCLIFMSYQKKLQLVLYRNSCFEFLSDFPRQTNSLMTVALLISFMLLRYYCCCIAEKSAKRREIHSWLHINFVAMGSGLTGYVADSWVMQIRFPRAENFSSAASRPRLGPAVCGLSREYEARAWSWSSFIPPPNYKYLQRTVTSAYVFMALCEIKRSQLCVALMESSSVTQVKF
jgi:hypothetical protein